MAPKVCAAERPAEPASAPLTAPWPAAAAGTLVEGRHRLSCLVSEGPRGQLWRAQDEHLDLPVALLVPADGTAEACLAAAAAQARVCSVGVARVFDAGVLDGTAVVIREWVDGRPLDAAVGDEPLPVAEALDAAASLGEALARAHQRAVVSGAVSPGAVVLRHGVPVLTDLGHAPTPPARLDADAAADVRALGAVLYALLTGHWPLPDDRPCPGLPSARRGRRGRLCLPGEVRPDVPRPVDTLVAEPMHRPAATRLPSLTEAMRAAARTARQPRPRRRRRAAPDAGG